MEKETNKNGSVLLKPKPPARRRYRSTDTSVEKCNEIQAENAPRGLLIHRDEFSGFLAALDKPGHEADRPYYLEGWNGNASYITDRIGRGTVRAEVLNISILGSIQPDKLREHLYKTQKAGNDGFLQRMQLAVYPIENKSYQDVDEYPNLEAEKRAHRIIHRLAEMDFRQYGAQQDDSCQFPYYRFDQEALSFFREWRRRLENEKLPSEENPLISEHLTKYRKLMPSLSLLFHLINIADGQEPGPVPLSCAELAAEWCEVLETHARRMYALLGTKTTAPMAIIAQKINDGVLKDGFSVRDAYRSNNSLGNRVPEVKAALAQLEAAHWIRKNPVPVAGEQGGQPPSPTYRINPKVFE